MTPDRPRLRIRIRSCSESRYIGVNVIDDFIRHLHKLEVLHAFWVDVRFCPFRRAGEIDVRTL